MARFLQILLIACLVVALCATEAPRYRNRNGRIQLSKQRSHFLARQEVAEVEEAAVTPYPSKKELIPEIPFDEAAAAAAPEAPVEIEVPSAASEDDINVSVNVDLPSEQASAEEEEVAADDVEGVHEPDLIYGPPEAEDVPKVNEITPEEEIEATIAEEEEAEAAAEEEIQSERLVFGRRINARKSARPAKLRALGPARARINAVKSARIVKAKVSSKARPARLQQLPQRQQFFAPQQFAAEQQQQPIFYYTAGQLRQW